MSEHAYHPLANLFPLLEGADFDELTASIKANGLRHPVVLHNGLILDGRNRYRACVAAGVAARFEDFAGADPLVFVVDENLRRRHLTESQRAMVAADMKRLPQGARTDLNFSPIGEKSQGERADIVKVGKRTVERADIVADEAEPELADAVRRGDVPVSVAADLVNLPAEEQRRIAREPERAGIEAKKFARERREQELGDKLLGLPARRYGVILADPEWRFEPWSRTTGMDRAADNHYPTSALKVIASRDVASIAADDCVLFLWATAPMLPHALLVMAAWGFDYKSNAVWAKDRIGTGYWFRNKHEHLLVGTRGKIPAPAMGEQWDSVMRPRHPNVHSQKPKYFRQMIEAYYPNLPKVELNAGDNEIWPGWERWGAPHWEAAE